MNERTEEEEEEKERGTVLVDGERRLPALLTHTRTLRLDY